MTVYELNDAMGYIDDRFLELADSYSHGRRIGAAPIRRAVLLLAAVLTLLIGSTAAACELNDDFRQAVMTFFHIEVSDSVERTPAEDVPLADGVTVTRVLVPDNGQIANGMFAVCSDDVEYKTGSRYDIYAHRDGQLVKLESHIYDETLEYNGKNYPIYIEWSTDGKNIAFNQVIIDQSVNVYVQYIRGSNSEVIVGLDGYPLIIDLETHNITHLCPQFQYKSGIYWNHCQLTDDRRAIIYFADKACCDLTTGKIYDLQEMCGAELDWICYLGGGKMAGWNYQGGTNVWRFDMDTQTAVRVITGAGGIVDEFGTHLIQTTDSGETLAISKLDGSVQTIDGLIWPDPLNYAVQLCHSPDGRRLIMTVRDNSSMKLERIYCIDFDSFRMVTIDRDTSRVGLESLWYWFDGRTFIIQDEDINCRSGESWYYIYTID